MTGTKPIRPSPLAKSTSTNDNGVVLPTPAAAPPKLKLSGSIISATCFTPYTVGYRRKAKDVDGRGPGSSTWELTPRRGSSALYDTLKHLASKESGWDHTIVGWTGNIAELSANAKTNPLQHLQNYRTAQVGNPPPATGNTPGRIAPGLLSQTKSFQTPPPVPVFKGTQNRMTMTASDFPRERPEEEQVPRVTKEEREELQNVLGKCAGEAGWDKIRAVWLGDEEDGGVTLAEMSRWMRYAEKGE